MSVRFVRLIFMAACSCSLLAGTSNALAQDAVQCQIKITTPQPGDQVGKDGRVRGTATIPKGTHLWVLAHMKDLVAEWWPQGRRPAVIEPDGTWVMIAGYGEAKDVGEKFEVAVVVVDAEMNAQLIDWFKTAKQEGYPPIKFPSTVQGCVPVKVTVTKTSHQ